MSDGYLDHGPWVVYGKWNVSMGDMWLHHHVSRDIWYGVPDAPLGGWLGFDGLTPMWGGRAWVAFAEDGWHFYDTLGDVVTDTGAIVEAAYGDGFPHHKSFVPYPEGVAAVVQVADFADASRQMEPYTVAGYGTSDVGNNSVVVGPVVVMGDGSVMLLVLQARQSGKKSSNYLNLKDFNAGNSYRFALPLEDPESEYAPLRMYELPEGGYEPVRIQYQVTNPKQKRVSAAASIALTAAVVFNAVQPMSIADYPTGEEDPENPWVPPADRAAQVLAVVTQTLGSGTPWYWVEVLPDCAITNDVEAEIIVGEVWPDGVDDSAIGDVTLDAAVGFAVPGIDASPAVCVPLIGSDSDVLIVAGIPMPGEPAAPVTSYREVLAPAGIAAPGTGGVEVASPAVLVAGGVAGGDAGAVRVTQASGLRLPGVDGGLAGGVVAETAAVLVVPGRTPSRMSTPRIRWRQKTLVAGVPAGSVGDVALASRAPALVLDVPGVEAPAVGDVVTPMEMRVVVPGCRPLPLGYPVVAPVSVAVLPGVDEGAVSTPRTTRLGWASVPGVDAGVCGGVALSAAAAVSPRGVMGGVARTPEVIAESVGQALLIPGVDWVAPGMPTISRVTEVRPAGVAGGVCGPVVLRTSVSVAPSGAPDGGVGVPGLWWDEAPAVVEVPGVPAGVAGAVVLVGEIPARVLAVPGVDDGLAGDVVVRRVLRLDLAGVDGGSVGPVVARMDAVVVVPGVVAGSAGLVRVRFGSVVAAGDWRILDWVRRWDGMSVPRWVADGVERRVHEDPVP